ncbi:hypothetical protein [Serratia rubidaea]|uniref:hypothetical protein n=1 Tax=Serratia rubidaea TaxID=61652 RepID=UPI0022B87CC6|nr:hypothetical protein [Serratia rubidaea]WBF45732.1 hypothetical protein OLD77_01340 [Serratia rubidaea]
MGLSAFPIARTPFILGCPESLPPTEQALAATGTTARRILAALNALPHPCSLQHYLDTLRVLMTQLPDASAGEMINDPRESLENRENDVAFGIERHQGDCAILLIAATLNAVHQAGELIARNGTSLAHAEWNTMISTAHAILRLIATPRAIPETHLPLQPAPSKMEDDAQDPLRRWVRGHLLFMVQCQGMSLSTQLLINAAHSEDIELACAQAHQLIHLMNISRITLEFATDLNQQQYLSQIRPTLMPPLAPPKMSGINWRDHVVMIRLMRQSTPAWHFVEQAEPELAARMRSVLAEVYTAHRAVCEKFVGEENTSLLAKENATTSAGQVLEGLKNSRLKLLKTKNFYDA